MKDYVARSDKLSDEERTRLLAAFDELVPKIPARALVRRASLWTLNADDFRDIPGLTLYQPRS